MVRSGQRAAALVLVLRSRAGVPLVSEAGTGQRHGVLGAGTIGGGKRPPGGFYPRGAEAQGWRERARAAVHRRDGGGSATRSVARQGQRAELRRAQPPLQESTRVPLRAVSG